MSEILNDIVLVGLGGAGAAYVRDVKSRSLVISRAVVVDCDNASMGDDADIVCKIIGGARTDGRGTGGDQVLGKNAFSDDASLIDDVINDCRLVVVVLGLGGGFGSGAIAPFLKKLQENGIRSICLATLPFSFEGEQKERMAKRQIPFIEDYADSFIVVPNDSLYGQRDDPIEVAQRAAMDSFSDIVSVVWKLLFLPGFITIGLEKVSSIISSSPSHTSFSVAICEGEERAKKVASELFSSPLLDKNFKADSVGSVIVSVLAGEDLRLSELSEISNGITERLPSGVELTFGTVLDKTIEGTIKIVAIFFGSGNMISSPASSAGERVKNAGKSTKKNKTDSRRQAGSGRFSGLSGTIYEGQDLDTPTYQRRNLILEK